MGQLEDLQLSHSFLELGNDFSSRVVPVPLRNAYLIHGNEHVAETIGLDPEAFQHPTFVGCFNGEQAHPRFAPLSMVYSGHQFGSYVPQLGDGRAMLLGEVKNKAGHWDLVTKGAGPTPYSRFADGRAVLRSSIREYLCSAAMSGLGIPSSQALCLIGSEEPVRRESVETGALIVRVAQSHVRFGSFEYFSHTNQHEALKALIDYTIQRNFPEHQASEQAIEGFFMSVVQRTALLMAQWQAVGFTHGVMNTDNMSIIGDTFDYGPFGFMDSFLPHYIPNHSDHGGRYAFDQQPGIGLWNCRALAYALKPVLADEAANGILNQFESIYHEEYLRLMARKLGITGTEKSIPELLNPLFSMMTVDEVDYHRFFRFLSDPQSGRAQATALFRNKSGIEAWFTLYDNARPEALCPAEERSRDMKAVNPKYVLRSYLAETAIRKAEDDHDHSVISELMTVLESPFDEHPTFERYAAEPPEWSRQIELSCSS